mmetsp:Transcript_7540/g.14744  ORF Transcript_7540/g.14744 Transcript_7540/m.14744 type:complete len:97 (+) Transcript_7540:107-397(+)
MCARADNEAPLPQYAQAVSTTTPPEEPPFPFVDTLQFAHKGELPRHQPKNPKSKLCSHFVNMSIPMFYFVSHYFHQAPSLWLLPLTLLDLHHLQLT